MLDGRIDAWDGGAGQQRGQQRASGDRVGCGGGDVHGDRRERQDEVGEASGRAEEVGDHGGQPGVGEQVGLGLAQVPGLGEQPTGEDLGAGRARPGVRQSVRRGRRVAGEYGAVNRPDRRARYQVGGDVVLEECLQHPDLDSTQAAATTEHEPDRPGQWHDIIIASFKQCVWPRSATAQTMPDRQP